MKAEDIVKMIRADVEELIQLHLLWEETNGAEGLRCFNFDHLLAKRDRTDREILEKAERNGAYIPDKEEYLAKIEKKREEQIKKEKA